MIKFKVENHKVLSSLYSPPSSACRMLSFTLSRVLSVLFLWCTRSSATASGFYYMTSSSPTFELDNCSLSDISLAPNWHSMQAFSPTTRDSLLTEDHCYGTYSEGYTAAPNSSLVSVKLMMTYT